MTGYCLRSDHTLQVALPLVAPPVTLAILLTVKLLASPAGWTPGLDSEPAPSSADASLCDLSRSGSCVPRLNPRLSHNFRP